MAEAKYLKPPIDSTSVVKYKFDITTESLSWSDELYTVFGYQKTDTAYNLEWWTQHIHPDDAMVLNEVLGTLVYPWVTEWTVDYRFKKADNTYVTVHDHTTVTRDDAQKAVRLTGEVWQSS